MFKIQSRNSVGYSLDSQELIVRVARISDVPLDVVTQINLSDRQVQISWEVPYDGGSPIFEYEILI